MRKQDGVNVLFISYDGLTDPLGSSQILPYIMGIANDQRRFSILSFEKADRYRSAGDQIRQQLQDRSIRWYPMTFTRRPRYVAKAWDLAKMYVAAVWISRHHGAQIVHCRSYPSAQVGMLVKWLSGARLLFDMRGFWVDERVEGGIWSRSKLTDRLLYRLYKRIERRLLASADSVVTLTQRSIPSLRQWLGESRTPIEVIPCCADFEHFDVTRSERDKVRGELGFDSNDLVLGYVGSLGTWYMLPEMLELFCAINSKHSNARFLVITKDWGSEQDRLRERSGIDANRVTVISANRTEVPLFLAAADVFVSFIRASFSKQASSPTKLAEVLALGIPVICNSGVGDVDELVVELGAGRLLTSLTGAGYATIAAEINEIAALGGRQLRERVRPHLSLQYALSRYERVYAQMERALLDSQSEG